MSELNIIQILFLSIYAGVAILDDISFGFGFNGIIQTAIVTGLVVGRVDLALFVGATFQSYALGLGTYGGSSVPNWTSAAMLVTALGGSEETTATLITLIGLPLATLGVQFDILGRMSNTLIQRQADKYVAIGDLKKIETMNLLGAIPWFLSRSIPMFVALSFGQVGLEAILTFLETYANWILNGFMIAGKLLPGIGFAILLHHLPVKKHLPWLIIGFVLSAYFNVAMLAISLLALAAAMLVYKYNLDKGVSEIDFGEFDDE